MDHSGNLNFTYDHRFKLSPAGISQYFIMMFGVGGYEKSEKRLYSTDNGALVYSPLITNLGFGYGIGYEFAHCLEIEPYVLAQWETMFFISKKHHQMALPNHKLVQEIPHTQGALLLTQPVSLSVQD